MFKVTVKEIKKTELPELDDEFASEVSEFDTLAEYKEDIKKTLEVKKADEAKHLKENAVVDKIIEGATMDMPEPMVENMQNQMIDEFAQRISYQGLSIEQYFQFTGLEREKFMEQIKPEAIRRIQSRLVLEAIVKAENIEVSDEEFDKEIEKMASMYQMKAEELKDMIGDAERKAIEQDIAVQKAVELAVEASKEV